LIRKVKDQAPDKKTHPLIGVLLFLISVLLLVITGPLGLIYGLLYTLFRRGITGVGEYLLKIAISVDQLGNVIMQHLLNALWIKKGGYPFGNRDETISSALGRNKKLGTLTGFGKAIDGFLDLIDPNHSLNSIDYYVEPSQNVIDKLGWILVEDRKVLCVRSKGEVLFYIPGGKREKGESDLMALSREIRKDLQVTLKPESFLFLGSFEAQADEKNKGKLVRLRCYESEYTGDFQPSSEIEAFTWVSYRDRVKLSLAGNLVFDHLHREGRI
jgi:ADP-ribose pyrophosphatase YjhB (NUDIX family)